MCFYQKHIPFVSFPVSGNFGRGMLFPSLIIFWYVIILLACSSDLLLTCPNLWFCFTCSSFEANNFNIGLYCKPAPLFLRSIGLCSHCFKENIAFAEAGILECYSVLKIFYLFFFFCHLRSYISQHGKHCKWGKKTALNDCFLNSSTGIYT